jgi:hypothetical protein
MSKFQSAVHNLGHHAVSGLCKLLGEGYAYCESRGEEVLTINLLNSEQTFTNALQSEIVNIRSKAASIIATTCGGHTS